MAAIFGGQKEGAGLAPWLVWKLRFSERLIVLGMLIVVGIGWIDIFEAVLLPIQIDELQLIMRADTIAQAAMERPLGGAARDVSARWRLMNSSVPMAS